MSQRDPVIALLDMSEAIQTIGEYLQGLSYQEYIADNRTKDAIVRNLEVLGEAATHIPDDVKERYRNIPWKNVIGLRNVVIHRYFGIDYATIWFIIKEQLPVLKNQIETIMKDFSR